MIAWRSGKRKISLVFRIAIIGGAFLISLLLIDKSIRPAITEAAALRGKIEAQKIIYSAAKRRFLELKGQTDSLVKISYDNQNRITSVETDTSSLGILASDIALSVAEKLSVIEEERFSIHLGSLLGSPLLAGRGPKINFRIETGGFLETNLESLFESAGINQTRHLIKLDLKVNIVVFIPGYVSHSSAEVSLIISETIIIGSVPENFVGVPLISEQTEIK